MVNKTLQILTISALLCAPNLFSAVKGHAIEITSTKQFNELYKSDKPMVTMYTRIGCPPCKATKPHFKKLAETMLGVNFCIVDVKKNALKSIISSIRGVPTFKFSHKGKPAQFAIDGRTTSSFSGGRSAAQLKKYLTDFTTKCPTK